MEVSAAKALNRILSDAKSAFDRVYNREVSGEELELLKTSFSDSEIERHRTEFDAEFLSNFKEYNDEELLHEYLVMNLEEVKSTSISQTTTEILRNDWEVNYLVRLKDISLILSFIRISEINTKPLTMTKNFFISLHRYLGEAFIWIL